jgi:carbonic anhydrase/acetyltransferase-like protein (isoleucine patch superfamily)
MLAALDRTAPVIAAGVYVAPNATIIGRVTIGQGSSIWFNTVLRGDMDAITVGEETNIQDLTMVHVDDKTPCVIGSRVTIGHRAVIHGCTLEDECLVGMGSIIQNRVRIGARSLVGSGSVVREGFEVPPGKLVVGVPAVIKRDLTGDETELIRRISRNYAARGRQYLTGLAALD